MKEVTIKTVGIVMAILLSTGVFAQKFHYGINAGANFAVQSDVSDIYNNENIKPGLHVGIFGNTVLKNNFLLQAEINYDQKGSKSDNYETHYDYITVPVLLKYSIGKSDKTALRFNVNMGPYAAYAIKAEAESNGQTLDMMDNTEEFEFGGILGLGMKYPVGKNNITLDLRLGLSFTEYDTNDTGLNNKYIGASIGYEF